MLRSVGAKGRNLWVSYAKPQNPKGKPRVEWVDEIDVTDHPAGKKCSMGIHYKQQAAARNEIERRIQGQKTQ